MDGVSHAILIISITITSVENIICTIFIFIIPFIVTLLTLYFVSIITDNQNALAATLKGVVLLFCLFIKNKR